RVDQVRVRRARLGLIAAALRRSLGELAPHAQETEVAIHRPLLPVHARTQELARALLGAALATRVVGAERVIPAGDARAARLVALPGLLELRQRDLPQQRDDDDGRCAEGEEHR